MRAVQLIVDEVREARFLNVTHVEVTDAAGKARLAQQHVDVLVELHRAGQRTVMAEVAELATLHEHALHPPDAQRLPGGDVIGAFGPVEHPVATLEALKEDAWVVGGEVQLP